MRQGITICISISISISILKLPKDCRNNSESLWLPEPQSHRDTSCHASNTFPSKRLRPTQCSQYHKVNPMAQGSQRPTHQRRLSEPPRELQMVYDYPVDTCQYAILKEHDIVNRRGFEIPLNNFLFTMSLVLKHQSLSQLNYAQLERIKDGSPIEVSFKKDDLAFPFFTYFSPPSLAFSRSHDKRVRASERCFNISVSS